MKLFSALGPGDLVGHHRVQMAGREIESSTSIIFSGQLIEYCREQGIQLLGISYNPRVDSLRDGPFQIENRPKWFAGAGGVRWHLSELFYAFYLVIRAVRFRADLAVIDSGSTHYFALALFPLLGIPVAVNFHNSIWPNGIGSDGLFARFVNWLNACFFRWTVIASIGVAPEIGSQLERLTGRSIPFFDYRAQFRQDGFIPNRDDEVRTPFRMLFVGRVEKEKGALDIPIIADGLRKEGKIPVLFEICGDGGALAELKRIVSKRGLSNVIVTHGQLNRSALLQVYARAHAIIVPSRVAEGLPQVCAEAVLFGLPIVTSALSNWTAYRAGVSPAKPNDIMSYVRAIRRLADDPIAYRDLRDACPAIAKQFLDRSRSYPAAVDRLIACIFPKWKLLDSYETIFERVP